MKVLITGGAGYIGSHTVKELLQRNYEIIIFDNLSRGHIEAVPDNVCFEKVDILDPVALKNAMDKYSFDSVIHFAAFAYVGESVEHPDMYYRNNVVGSFNLINASKNAGVNNFVFSSTCSVYGNPDKIPLSENMPALPINPYARTKLMIENMLSDFSNAYDMKYVALRYFNAAGDSEDGSIGESHNPEPHIIPLVMFTALGKRDKVLIFGDDYPTDDGTCIRDYIHVSDLADAHIRALEFLKLGGNSTVINLGTGTGFSVKEIINISKEITGVDIKTEISARRPGDPAVLVADNKKAFDVLGWSPKFNLKDIIKSAWKWHKNPVF